MALRVSRKIKIDSLEDGPRRQSNVFGLMRTSSGGTVSSARLKEIHTVHKLANATERIIIAEGGNGWAHGGDAIVDVELYYLRHGRRKRLQSFSQEALWNGPLRL